MLRTTTIYNLKKVLLLLLSLEWKHNTKVNHTLERQYIWFYIVFFFCAWYYSFTKQLLINIFIWIWGFHIVLNQKITQEKNYEYHPPFVVKKKKKKNQNGITQIIASPLKSAAMNVINYVTELSDLRLSLTFKLRLFVYSPLIHEYELYTSLHLLNPWRYNRLDGNSPCDEQYVYLFIYRVVLFSYHFIIFSH